jgi:hypothetical protein
MQEVGKMKSTEGSIGNEKITKNEVYGATDG